MDHKKYFAGHESQQRPAGQFASAAAPSCGDIATPYKCIRWVGLAQVQPAFGWKVLVVDKSSVRFVSKACRLFNTPPRIFVAGRLSSETSAFAFWLDRSGHLDEDHFSLWPYFQEASSRISCVPLKEISQQDISDADAKSCEPLCLASTPPQMRDSGPAKKTESEWTVLDR